MSSNGKRPPPPTGGGGTPCTLQHLLDAIAKIHRQKQCPSVVRIVRAVRQALQYDIDTDEVLRQLEAGALTGALLRVENNGVTSFKEPPKQSTPVVTPVIATKTPSVASSTRNSTEPPAKKAATSTNNLSQPRPPSMPEQPPPLSLMRKDTFDPVCYYGGIDATKQRFPADDQRASLWTDYPAAAAATTRHFDRNGGRFPTDQCGFGVGASDMFDPAMNAAAFWAQNMCDTSMMRSASIVPSNRSAMDSLSWYVGRASGWPPPPVGNSFNPNDMMAAANFANYAPAAWPLSATGSMYQSPTGPSMYPSMYPQNAAAAAAAMGQMYQTNSAYQKDNLFRSTTDPWSSRMMPEAVMDPWTRSMCESYVDVVNRQPFMQQSNMLSAGGSSGLRGGSELAGSSSAGLAMQEQPIANKSTSLSSSSRKRQLNATTDTDQHRSDKSMNQQSAASAGGERSSHSSAFSGRSSSHQSTVDDRSLRHQSGERSSHQTSVNERSSHPMSGSDRSLTHKQTPVDNFQQPGSGVSYDPTRNSGSSLRHHTTDTLPTLPTISADPLRSVSQGGGGDRSYRLENSSKSSSISNDRTRQNSEHLQNRSSGRSSSGTELYRSSASTGATGIPAYDRYNPTPSIHEISMHNFLRQQQQQHELPFTFGLHHPSMQSSADVSSANLATNGNCFFDMAPSKPPMQFTECEPDTKGPMTEAIGKAVTTVTSGSDNIPANDLYWTDCSKTTDNHVDNTILNNIAAGDVCQGQNHAISNDKVRDCAFNNSVDNLKCSVACNVYETNSSSIIREPANWCDTKQFIHERQPDHVMTTNSELNLHQRIDCSHKKEILAISKNVAKHPASCDRVSNTVEVGYHDKTGSVGGTGDWSESIRPIVDEGSDFNDRPVNIIAEVCAELNDTHIVSPSTSVVKMVGNGTADEKPTVEKFSECTMCIENVEIPLESDASIKLRNTQDVAHESSCSRSNPVTLVASCNELDVSLQDCANPDSEPNTEATSEPECTQERMTVNCLVEHTDKCQNDNNIRLTSDQASPASSLKSPAAELCVAVRDEEAGDGGSNSFCENSATERIECQCLEVDHESVNLSVFTEQISEIIEKTVENNGILNSEQQGLTTTTSLGSLNHSLMEMGDDSNKISSTDVKDCKSPFHVVDNEKISHGDSHQPSCNKSEIKENNYTKHCHSDASDIRNAKVNAAKGQNDMKSCGQDRKETDSDRTLIDRHEAVRRTNKSSKHRSHKRAGGVSDVGSRYSRLSPHCLVDSLTQFFTPSNKRSSRVSQSAAMAFMPQNSLIQKNESLILSLRKNASRLDSDVSWHHHDIGHDSLNIHERRHNKSCLRLNDVTEQICYRTKNEELRMQDKINGDHSRLASNSSTGVNGSCISQSLDLSSKNCHHKDNFSYSFSSTNHSNLVHSTLSRPNREGLTDGLSHLFTATGTRRRTCVVNLCAGSDASTSARVVKKSLTGYDEDESSSSCSPCSTTSNMETTRCFDRCVDRSRSISDSRCTYKIEERSATDGGHVENKLEPSIAPTALAKIGPALLALKNACKGVVVARSLSESVEMNCGISTSKNGLRSVDSDDTDSNSAGSSSKSSMSRCASVDVLSDSRQLCAPFTAGDYELVMKKSCVDNEIACDKEIKADQQMTHDVRTEMINVGGAKEGRAKDEVGGTTDKAGGAIDDRRSNLTNDLIARPDIAHYDRVLFRKSRKIAAKRAVVGCVDRQISLNADNSGVCRLENILREYDTSSLTTEKEWTPSAWSSNPNDAIKNRNKIVLRFTKRRNVKMAALQETGKELLVSRDGKTADNFTAQSTTDSIIILQQNSSHSLPSRPLATTNISVIDRRTSEHHLSASEHVPKSIDVDFSKDMSRIQADSNTSNSTVTTPELDQDIKVDTAGASRQHDSASKLVAALRTTKPECRSVECQTDLYESESSSESSYDSSDSDDDDEASSSYDDSADAQKDSAEKSTDLVLDVAAHIRKGDMDSFRDAMEDIMQKKVEVKSDDFESLEGDDNGTAQKFDSTEVVASAVPTESVDMRDTSPQHGDCIKKEQNCGDMGRSKEFSSSPILCTREITNNDTKKLTEQSAVSCVLDGDGESSLIGQETNQREPLARYCERSDDNSGQFISFSKSSCTVDPCNYNVDTQRTDTNAVLASNVSCNSGVPPASVNTSLCHLMPCSTGTTNNDINTLDTVNRHRTTSQSGYGIHENGGSANERSAVYTDCAQTPSMYDMCLGSAMGSGDSGYADSGYEMLSPVSDCGQTPLSSLGCHMTASVSRADDSQYVAEKEARDFCDNLSPPQPGNDSIFQLCTRNGVVSSDDQYSYTQGAGTYEDMGSYTSITHDAMFRNTTNQISACMNNNNNNNGCVAYNGLPTPSPTNSSAASFNSNPLSGSLNATLQAMAGQPALSELFDHSCPSTPGSSSCLPSTLWQSTVYTDGRFPSHAPQRNRTISGSDGGSTGETTSSVSKLLSGQSDDTNKHRHHHRPHGGGSRVTKGTSVSSRSRATLPNVSTVDQCTAIFGYGMSTGNSDSIVEYCQYPTGNDYCDTTTMMGQQHKFVDAYLQPHGAAVEFNTQSQRQHADEVYLYGYVNGRGFLRQ